MIRRIMVLMCAAVLMFAYSNFEGGYGLLRTESADNGSAGHFHIGLFMRGFSETRDVTLVGDSTGSAVNAGGDIFLALGYAFTDNFAFNVGTQYHGDGVNWEGSDYNRASIGFGDTKVAVKLTFGPKCSKFALNPYVTLPTGSNRGTALTQRNYPIFGEAWGNDGGVFRYFSSGALDMGINGLASFKMGKLNLDLNLGYLDRNKNDADWGYMNNQSMYRAALSLELGAVVPFVEVGAIDYNGEDKFFTIFKDEVWGPNESYITPGLSFRSKNFEVKLAVDIRGFDGENTEPFPTPITDSANITTGWGVAPAWAGILGFSYCADFIGEKPQTGLITGTVSDAKTGAALEADVVIKKDGAPVQTVFADDGSFQVAKLDPGVYAADVALEGYEPASVEFAVKAGETTPVVIQLAFIPVDGDLIIKVIDIGTKQPVEAELMLNDEALGKLSQYEKTVKAGAYKIDAKADEALYLPYSQTVKVVAGQKNVIEVALVKKEFKIVLPQVYFEIDKAELKPESYPVLDEAAGTLAKVFAGNDKVMIEVQGHTDNTGAADYNLTLSQKRAETVKNYLVTKHNLDANRFNAKGYGLTRPIATNNTKEGRATNRRVEFVITK
jgi:outer membrane protein OmpA-like peptidoglycan-associated protein